MTNRPILFSAPMVRALLDGRKTQTRRLAWRWRESTDGWRADSVPTIWQRVKPGDRLWARETWGEQRRGGLVYRADDLRALGSSNPWRSPIHMPRQASRITLTVTAVRVERLQEISEADARAEGILFVPGHGHIKPADLAEGFSNYLNCTAGFADLWDDIHGPGSWSADPEVVVLTFDAMKHNIDEAKS